MFDAVRALMEKDGKVVYPVTDVDSVLGLDEKIGAMGFASHQDVSNAIVEAVGSVLRESF